MNETPDPLEVELSALQPQELPPGLRQRIAERLAQGAAMPDCLPLVRKRGRDWWMRIAIAGGLAAACVAALVLWWANSSHREAPPIAHQPEVTPQWNDVIPSRDAQRVVSDTESFTWPIEETSPVRVSISIPTELFD
jgi:hypothetical protein